MGPESLLKGFEVAMFVSVTPSTPIQRRAFLLDWWDDWKPRSPWAKAKKQ
jgi:hypothetical protein